MTRCKRCIMDDSSDVTIRFDSDGYCNYCTTALADINRVYFPNEEGEKRLNGILQEIKEAGRGKKYDCIMGISGGLDSSYLAYLGYSWGLRILAVHVDDGFDTEISKNNIRKLCEKTGITLQTITPDSKQFCALTKAYMKAGVPNLAVPQDNVLFAAIYRYMRENHIKYFLSGGNFALECILQAGNTYTAFDTVNIRAIHRRFGEEPINKLTFISAFQRLIDSRVLHINTPRLLNFIDYNRERAFKELHEFCGFEYYGRKHLENTLTAFVQLYWFPKKFHVDKRTSHLSSMIASGQMTRDDALREYAEPLYSQEYMDNCIAIIKKSLQISDDEFENIMNRQTHQHTDFAHSHFPSVMKTVSKCINAIRRVAKLHRQEQ